jgi:hypothetical protein
VSAFKEAVQAMKDRGGWKSEGKPEEPCPKCRQSGYVFHTTIRGITRGDCSLCSHDWPIK